MKVNVNRERLVQVNFVSFLDYLCGPKANIYGIEFTRFKMRDMDDGRTLFEIAKPDDFEEEPGEHVTENEVDEDPNAGRFVRYKFTPEFLKLHTVGAT